MRFLLSMLMLFASLSATGLAQSPMELEVRKLDLSSDQKGEIRQLLGQGERQLEAQHEQAFRDLNKILSSGQMQQLRTMSRWGRYGPPVDQSAEGAEMLTVLSQLERASSINQAAARLSALWPTPRQGQAFSQALQGGAPGMESRLRAIFTPEQLEFLRQLERLEQSEDW